MKPRIKLLAIFSCPYCSFRKKPFTSINGLNVHLTKSHPEHKVKITLVAQGRACPRRTMTGKGRLTR